MFQSSRACVGGRVFVTQSTKVSHCHLDKDEGGRPIPLLDANKMTIAGVKIPSVHDCVPLRLRDEIKQAIDKLTFGIRYEIKADNKDRRKVFLLFCKTIGSTLIPARSVVAVLQVSTSQECECVDPHRTFLQSCGLLMIRVSISLKLLSSELLE
jgi:hypothetical protein